MYSPEVMSQARARGDYLRYKSEIGATLSEPVIPVTAREWTQDYEWHVHAPIAAKVGMKPEIDRGHSGRTTPDRDERYALPKDGTPLPRFPE
jgi:4-carboxymuconolactone decarboxylase